MRGRERREEGRGGKGRGRGSEREEREEGRAGERRGGKRRGDHQRHINTLEQSNSKEWDLGEGKRKS